MELRSIWDDLPLINDFEDIIDLGVTKGFVNWQLYGSRKPGHKAYILENYFTIKYILNDNDWTIEENDISKINLKDDLPKLSAQYTKYPTYSIQENITKRFEIEKEQLVNRKPNKSYKLIIKKFIG